MKKGPFWTCFSQFFNHQGKTQKFLQHISNLQKYEFCSPFWHFLPNQFCKNYKFTMYGFSLVQLLVLILICAIFENQLITKWWANFKLECILLISFHTNAKFSVICRTPDFEWWLVKIKFNRKHTHTPPHTHPNTHTNQTRFPSSSHFAFHR